MTDQSVASLSVKSGLLEDLSINQKEKGILRELAKRTAELAAGQKQEEKRKLWTRHNCLQETRPLIFCDPENGWNEIITDQMMHCNNYLAKQWEMALRKEIFWGETMGDDRVVEPYFNINCVFEESDWGLREKKIGGIDGGSYRWEAPVKDYSYMDKLHFPIITVEGSATEKVIQLAKEVFNGILEVRIKNSWWWTLGMTWTLVNLRGLEQIMLDMYDYPEQLHRLMAFLRDGHLAKLDFLEDNNLLSLNNDGTYVGSGGFGYTDELPQKDFDGKVRTIDMWGFGESQETSLVSPEMFAEFILPYQIPVLERFGLNCYGCCEPIDRRWESVKKIPRLRRISVSPWADLKKMADYLEDKYIYSLKPNPAYLAVSAIDEDHIRKSLRDAILIAHGCRIEIIMKDNHTLGKNPMNAVRWCEIAREEVERGM